MMWIALEDIHIIMNIQKIQKLKKEACKIECIVLIKRTHNFFLFWALNRPIRSCQSIFNSFHGTIILISLLHL